VLIVSETQVQRLGVVTSFGLCTVSVGYNFFASGRAGQGLDGGLRAPEKTRESCGHCITSH